MAARLHWCPQPDADALVRIPPTSFQGRGYYCHPRRAHDTATLYPHQDSPHMSNLDTTTIRPDKNVNHVSAQDHSN